MNASPTFDPRTLLTVTECAAYIGKGSRPALYRWQARFGLRPYRRGLYRRSDVDAALQREMRKATK